MEIQNTPVLGGTAPRHAWRTAEKLANFARCYVGSIHSSLGVRRYLDVGCGNGFITELVSPGFDRVVGIDVEEERLDDFRAHIRGNPHFEIRLMSAARIEFPGECFSLITCFEVLEHVPDLNASVSEMVRVCGRGGVVVLSVPQVWFPFENHGARVGKRIFPYKIPLLPYIRPLHRRYSLARVFSSAEVDRLFLSRGMELLATSYASPQFERGAVESNSWESKVVYLRKILDRWENVPVLRALTGVSMLKAYRKIL
jgi:SAM-dependent methyltransferase